MPPSTLIGHLSSSDQDAVDSHAYSLVAGPGDSGNAFFAISGADLLTNATFDYETITSYSIRLRTTDLAGATYEEVFTIDIVPVNEYAPTAILLDPFSIPENRAQGTMIGQLIAVDQDQGDPHTFELVAGAGDQDNAAFYLEDGLLKSNQFFNYEERSAYSIRVRAIDSGGLAFEQVITVYIQDQLESYLPILQD
jgi:hypothetical protein